MYKNTLSNRPNDEHPVPTVAKEFVIGDIPEICIARTLGQQQEAEKGAVS